MTPKKAKKFLNKINANYYNGAWRIEVEGNGFPLSRSEQNVNNKGGFFIGRNWKEALSNYALYEELPEALEAHNILTKLGYKRIRCFDDGMIEVTEYQKR